MATAAERTIHQAERFLAAARTAIETVHRTSDAYERRVFLDAGCLMLERALSFHLALLLERDRALDCWATLASSTEVAEVVSLQQMLKQPDSWFAQFSSLCESRLTAKGQSQGRGIFSLDEEPDEQQPLLIGSSAATGEIDRLEVACDQLSVLMDNQRASRIEY